MIYYLLGTIVLAVIVFMIGCALENKLDANPKHKWIFTFIMMLLIFAGVTLCVLALKNEIAAHEAEKAAQKEKYEEKYEGYTTLARFVSQSVSHPSIEICTDKDSVTYIDRHYKKTGSILDARLVICK